MAKLKALPKALIVGSVIAVGAFAAYKFMPERKPAEPQVAETIVGATPAVPVAAAPVPAAKVELPAVTAAVQAAQETSVAQTGKLAGAGIASGQKTGTNWPMVEDVVKTCSTSDYPLRNVITNGTVDNILKVYTDPNSQFGIAQVDGLAAQAKVDAKMMSRIVSVFPFFSVEIHAITSSSSPIETLADLQGKRVIEGPEGSGTNVTVQMIKQLTGIQWTTVPGNLSQKDGLAAVQTGGADVEFIVAGQPIQVLSGAKGIKLIPIKHPALDKAGVYTQTQLPTGAYPWQSHATPTYKVDNVLVTFAYKNQYQTEISNLVTCITKNIDQLQANGHPKWRDVEVTDLERSKWPVHPSALAAVRKTLKDAKK